MTVLEKSSYNLAIVSSSHYKSSNVSTVVVKTVQVRCGEQITPSIITPGCVRSCVRASVCLCVRVKNGNGSRMRALPDELSPVTRAVHGHRSKYHVSVFKCEMMLALSSDYKRLPRDVRHFNTK